MIKNVLIDVDGVLWQGGKKIPGAGKTLEFLEKNGYNFLLLTNITRHTTKQLAKNLSKQGIKVKLQKIMSPVKATIDFIKSEKQKAACFLIASDEVKKEFRNAGISVLKNQGKADFVVVFFFQKTTYEIMNNAFWHLQKGARLVTQSEQKSAPLGKNGKLVLSNGPFAKALEYASGKKPIITGKPSTEFFKAALFELNAKPHETVMVGDSIGNDIIGANNTGIKAVLVKTGNFSENELQKSVIKPDAVIESIADLPQYLERNK